MSKKKKLKLKKGMSGQEAGILICEILADFFEYANGNSDAFHYSSEDLTKIKELMTTDEQKREFYPYELLFNGLNNYRKAEVAYEQMFFHGYYRVYNKLKSILRAEKALALTRYQPLILTQCEYDSICSTVKQEKEGRIIDLGILVFRTIRYYIDHRQEAPGKIKRLLLLYEGEKYTEGPLTKAYKHLFTRSYLKLADGTEQDRCTPKAWEKATTDFVYKIALKFYDELKDLSEPPRKNNKKQVIESFMKFIKYRAAEAVYNSNTLSQELYKMITGKEYQGEDLTAQIDNLFPNFGKESFLRAFDLLEICKRQHKPSNKFELLKIIVTHHIDLDYGQRYDLFRAAFGDIVEAVFDVLADKLGIKQTAAATWGELLKVKFSFKELAELKINDFEKLIQISPCDIIKAYGGTEAEKERIYYSGIAITQPGTAGLNLSIDCSDLREAPDLLNEFESLSTITEEDINALLSSYRLMIRALDHLVCFRRLLYFFDMVWKTKYLFDAGNTVPNINDYIQLLNGLIYEVYINVYGATDQEKREKRNNLILWFGTLNVAEHEPTAQNLQRVVDKITPYTVVNLFSDFETLVNDLIAGE